ncbi:hypothetical protein EMPS_07386 [Entomortierella parvispora]|uniref:Uncharacterized protein n=1 Tax=Entomortierella parvispora TaxID=205924 RepID=A0A9P3HEG5_9FUNG|nr:hypothetical protein EMPS_07386 [Entomortierella parvispora]
MVSFKSCVLFLVAAATAKAAVIPDNAVPIPDNAVPIPDNVSAIPYGNRGDGAVYLKNGNGIIWHVSAGSSCASVPDWLNDQSTEYSITSTYTCVVFEHSDCSGRIAQINITNGQFKPVPDVGGISAIECFFVN